MKREIHRILAALTAIFLLCLAAFPAFARDLPRVIILNSYHPGFLWSDAETTGLLQRLREEYPELDPPVEYLDAKRHPGGESLERMERFLLEKYRDEKIDLVLCLDNPALDLLARYKDELMPGASVVFGGISGFEPAMLNGRRRVTGVQESTDNKGTLEIALALHPGVKQVLIVTDGTVSGRVARREAEALEPQFAGRLNFLYSPPVTFEEAATEIGALPAHSIVLIHSFSTDRAGRHLSLTESTRVLTSAAKVPVYSIQETRLGHGIIGGRLLSGKQHGRRVAELALRTLAGEDPDRIPVETNGAARPMFDYLQLERFGVSLRGLPEGSIVLNKPVSIFESHQRFALGSLAVIALLIVMIIHLSLSIARRKRAEDELRRSEARYRLLSDNMADVIWTQDTDTNRFTYVSPSVGRMRGFTPEEAVALTPEETLSPESYQRVAEYLPGRLAAFASGDASVRIQTHQLEWLRKDGSAVPVETVSTLLTDDAGRVAGMLGVTRDISERKKAEGAALERETKLRSIFRAAPVGIGMIIDRVFQEVNDAMSVITGYSRDELLGMRGRVLYESEEDYEYVGREMLSQFARRRTGIVENRWRRKDGDVRDVMITATPLDAMDLSVGMIFTVTDITEQKRTEAENARLELQLVRSQKLESIGRLAGGVAHDFNNMLTVVLGYAELIKTRLPVDDPMLKEILQIEKAALTSRDITRQLLAFSRKEVISPRPLKLNERVDEIRQMLTRLIGEDIVLQVRLRDEPWTILLDPVQLDQILMNLCVNARDAMPDGGRLTIEVSNVAIDSTFCSRHFYATPGEYVLLEVSDEGTGMDEETLAHVFEPFFTTKEVGRGTGLGLATVYGIVKQNGGIINAYSESGQGTSFKLYFPRTAAEEAPRKMEEIGISSGSGTVLLVEDSEPVRTLIKSILETIGYTVLAVTSPRQALSTVEKGDLSIDLLLTDVVMPEMNGVELKERIEALRPGIRTLFMSGYTANMIARRGVLKEGVHFIQKPFSMKDIALKIREVALDGGAKTAGGSTQSPAASAPDDGLVG